MRNHEHHKQPVNDIAGIFPIQIHSTNLFVTCDAFAVVKTASKESALHSERFVNISGTGIRMLISPE
jgi:hypothetical protein